MSREGLLSPCASGLGNQFPLGSLPAVSFYFQTVGLNRADMIPIGVDQNDIQTSLGKDRSEEGTHAARSDYGDIGVCDSHQQTQTG